MVKSFEISTPLPSRGSAAALRAQLLDHLMRSRPSVGEKFFSDHELARIAQLSRPTVRRALDDLERDGWIERRPGVGTFIGPRAAISIHLPPVASDGRNGNGHDRTRRTVRLALLMHMLGDFAHDWYVAGLIGGVDAAAEETGVSLELLGNRDGDVASVSRRMMQSRPDVFAFAAPSLRHTLLLAEARRHEIPCIGTGTLLASMGVPSVCEDGHDGMRRAVQHLAEQGHRRIGLVVPPFALPWVFHRRRGYLNGMTDAGLPADEGMVLWLDHHDQPRGIEVFAEYLDQRKPTAIVLASWTVVEALTPLIQSGKVLVPEQLSVVCFDQHPGVAAGLGVNKATTIDIPLHEMGRRLAQMARQIAAGEAVEPITNLPCSLTEGDSVAAPARAGINPNTSDLSSIGGIR